VGDIQNIKTKRLVLRPLEIEDANFIYALVNDPDWLRYIGDKGVHSLEDAKAYIINGPQTMYRRHGFGLLLVETLGQAEPVGLCGLLQRDNLVMPDIGFAFLAQARGRGYAFEAAAVVISHYFNSNDLDVLAAITATDNQKSMALLIKLGFKFKCKHHMDKLDPGSNLFELSKCTWFKTA
jgi:[ribosomal protein S5]-alanine N-acetyltransferase